MMPYRVPGWSRNREGPGIMPCNMNAPIRMAVQPSPGMPKVIRGIRVEPVVALLAASEAATPSISPLPKLSPFRDIFLAWS